MSSSERTGPPFKPCMRISRTRLTGGLSMRSITRPPASRRAAPGSERSLAGDAIRELDHRRDPSLPPRSSSRRSFARLPPRSSVLRSPRTPAARHTTSPSAYTCHLALTGAVQTGLSCSALLLVHVLRPIPRRSRWCNSVEAADFTSCCGPCTRSPARGFRRGSGFRYPARTPGVSLRHLGPATRRSDAYRGGTHTRWRNAASGGRPSPSRGQSFRRITTHRGASLTRGAQHECWFVGVARWRGRGESARTTTQRDSRREASSSWVRSPMLASGATSTGARQALSARGESERARVSSTRSSGGAASGEVSAASDRTARAARSAAPGQAALDRPSAPPTSAPNPEQLPRDRSAPEASTRGEQALSVRSSPAKSSTSRCPTAMSRCNGRQWQASREASDAAQHRSSMTRRSLDAAQTRAGAQRIGASRSPRGRHREPPAACASGTGAPARSSPRSLTREGSSRSTSSNTASLILSQSAES
ncbi:MAG: hypothetical protein RL685_1192 [Pseudomonadota bacterium]